MGSGNAILVLLVALLVSTDVDAAGDFYPAERNALIQLRETLTSTMNLHSIWTGPPCYKNKSQWYGISCSNSHVVALSLDGIELTGKLQPNALQSLTYLTNLSLSSNALHGELPTLSGLDRLRIVSLSSNRFSGSIPIQFISLPGLSTLKLEDNLLNGSIPPFNQQSLVEFNVSYNFLNGSIPATSTLQRFPKSSFDHNLDLCGEPLDKACPVDPPADPPVVTPPPPSSPRRPPRPSSGGKELKLWSLVLIALGAMLVPFLVIVCFLCYSKRRQKATQRGDTSGDASADFADKPGSSTATGFAQPDRTAELEFFDRERPSFDLDDLLRSSAELLGKGKLGNTYRVTLETGQTVAVKRLKDMGGVSKKEFVQQMQLIGKMKHENLAELTSFYYSKIEKLAIFENVDGGSLMQLLHDNRGAGRVPLNWAARLGIIQGIARGLAHLHQSLPSHKVPHANLKSSNVLILHNNGKLNYHPKLTDFGFLPLFPSPQQARKLAIGRTPEFLQGRKLTKKADVYCFGLVLLEVITGQAPSDDEEDLSEWVKSAVSNSWSTDILDLEIVAEKEGHEEMLHLSEIALSCTLQEAERRPKMSELLKRVGEIREANIEQREG